MKIKRISKKQIILALCLGLLTIVIVGIITSVIAFFVSSSLARTLSFQDFKTVPFQHPYSIISWTLRIVSLLSPIFGGFIVGFIIKQKGFLYGGILGLILLIISVSIASLTFILPHSVIYGPRIPVNYGHDLALKNIINSLLNSPIIIILTSFGGWFGERFNKTRKA